MKQRRGTALAPLQALFDQIQIMSPMKTHIIYPAVAPLPALAGRVFNPDDERFCRGAFAPIDCYPWAGDYRPEARAYLAWDDAGLRVLLCANEPTVSGKVTAFGGPVWTDSCLECFLQPFGGEPRYVNIEVNAAGAALIGIGPDREHRGLLAVCPEGMDIQASRHDGGWWAVAYTVPFRWLEEAFGRSLDRSAPIRGNFYSCDESIHPHFGSWSPIEAPKPDFHRPECFGRLILAERTGTEYFDVCDEQGEPTGAVVSRDTAHREGIRHRTAHVWVVRRVDGRWQVLLQKRSENKDSFPGKYDTSSAGHIPAGDGPLESALRELGEELGIHAKPEQLHCAGNFDIRYEKEFHGRLFRDNEFSHVYVYMEPVDVDALTLQAEEVSRVDWFDLEQTWSELPTRRDIYCVPTQGMAVLRRYLKDKY